MNWSILLRLKTEQNRLLDQAILGFGLDFKQFDRLDRIEKLILRIENRKHH